MPVKLVGLMPVRNEAWCLGLSARVALTWCDELVIMEHACTDDTRGHIDCLASEYPGRVHHMQIGGDWHEMTHRQAMLAEARSGGATHIAMIDADEILTGNLLGLDSPTMIDGATTHYSRIKNQVYLVDRMRMLTLPLYNLRGGIHRYHANGLWGNRIVSVAFADDPLLHWGGDTFHQREPRGKRLSGFQPIAQGDGGVLHLWGASERRLLAKHALYKCTERLRWPAKDVREIDQMYSLCIKGAIREDPATWTYADVPEAWWAPYAAWMKYLDVDAEPWQEAEVRRLVYGPQRGLFTGLDLFGVA